MANLSNINNKFLVTTGGNILIGQTAAVGSSIFQVTGNSTFAGNVSLIASSAINLRVTDGTQNLYVGSSGNTRFGLGAGASIIQSTGASFGVGTQDGNSLILGTNNTAALTIDASQNATFGGSLTAQGIGGTSLTTPLIQLQGNITILNKAQTSYISFATRDTSGSDTIMDLTNVTINGGDPGPYLPLSGGTLTGNLTISKTGNAALTITGGTTNTAKINFGDSSNDDAGIIEYTNDAGGSDNMKFTVGTIEQMRLANSLLTFPSTGVSEVRGDIGSNKFAIGNMGDASSQMMVSSRGFLTFNVSNTGSAKDATERMRIRSSGTVGIGSDGFDSQMLTIAAGTLDGAIYATSTDANCFASFRDSSSTSNIQYGAIGNNHVFRKDTNEQMRIDSSGNVGIGTTSPDSKLDIASTTGPQLRLTRNAGTEYSTLYSDSAGGLVISSYSSGTSNYQIFSINSSEKVRIINNGNVGIGTTSPQQKLHVNGNVRVGTDTGFIDFARPGGAIVGGIGWHTDDYFYVAGHPTAGTGAGNSVRVYAFGALLSLGNPTAGDALTVAVNGNVGIGTTSPDVPLDVEGAIQASESGGDFIRMQTDGANNIFDVNSGDYVFRTSGFAERMRIDSDGNVGIGVTGPSSKLQVGGTTSFYNGGPADGAINTGQVESISTGFNLAGSASIDISTISVTTNKWKVLLTGGFANNYEGGGLVSSSLEIEVDYNSPTVVVGSTGITFSRNGTTGKLQVTNTNASYRVTFVGTIKVINYPQSLLPVVSKVILGRVGIGTSSPECKLHVVSTTTDNTKTVLIQNSSTGDASIMFNISGDTYSLGIDNSDGDKFKLSYGALGTNDRLVIDSSGNVGIGTTSPTYKLHVASSNNVSIFEDTSDASGAAFIVFNRPSVFSMGSITRNGSANSVSYNTGSDYRLKEDLKDFNALELVNNITAYDYKWKDVDQRDYGFIAHELKQTLPNVVTGEKDGEKMQGVDYSKLTPILLKAIQELEARVKELENK
jgi:hypothetical protein